MPAKSNEDLHIEHGAETALRPIYSKPWWRGVGNGTASSMVDHSSSMVINGAMQAQTNARLDGRANFNKEFRTAVESQSDGNSKSANQHTKSVSSSVVPAMGQHVGPNSQMEFVGHSIVMSSYPYADPQYGGMLTPYEPQTMGAGHNRLSPLAVLMQGRSSHSHVKSFSEKKQKMTLGAHAKKR
ncbi:hypothetical protein ACFXTH_040976 [Malus domestica]